MGRDDYERVEIESAAELRAWLAENHRRDESIWLVRYKKSGGDKHVSWSQVVDEVLCYGWIDGQTRKLDAHRTMNLLSPRRPGSHWSKINKDKVEALIAEGRMTEHGLARIEAAKADGSWTLLDDAEALVVPDDLAAALGKNPKARAGWDAFPDSSKKPILFWITSAKRDTTREKRVRETARLAAKGLRANFPEAKGK